MDVFLLFLLVGLLAQIVDGALGMAYGVIANTVLLAFGVPPAAASASVHVAKIFTGAASAVSHVMHRNIRWSLFWPLAAGGMIGGVVGTYVLTGIPGETIKPFILLYLLAIGIWVLWRAARDVRLRLFPLGWSGPLGFVGGLLDAIGGGGWGPTVTSTLVGAGTEPRRAIGTVNTAELLVTVAISAAFLTTLLTGRWSGGALENHAAALAGLIIGGVIAAPFAGWITKRVPARLLTYGVGVLIVILAGYQGLQLAGFAP
ncbi:sulfite exporter TauE/SafE family protein [uncultured Brevundimonas sp.]|uniref:sulfite exporter TauE/SafE family protein n=1 Tax=uncultured Brevundimonas sp. TaxID=213418 RepID=UPI0030EBF46E|tara:strand:+ start:174 stop:950 length:777 start_codon:yes stop_codon:yes gene_type:complete